MLETLSLGLIGFYKVGSENLKTHLLLGSSSLVTMTLPSVPLGQIVGSSKIKAECSSVVAVAEGLSICHQPQMQNSIL